MSKKKISVRCDPVAQGSRAEAIFEGLKPGDGYGVHVLFPSGESKYGARKATAEGELRVAFDVRTPALHVVELYQGPQEERKVLATALMVATTE